MSPEDAVHSHKNYKIQLVSGRILGPMDLERIRLLILKGQVTGVETAREHPSGEWLDINQIDPIAELLAAKIAGTLEQKSSPSSPLPSLVSATNTMLLPGATQVLDSGTLAPLPTLHIDLDNEEVISESADVGDKTQVGTLEDEPPSAQLNPIPSDDDRTRVEPLSHSNSPTTPPEAEVSLEEETKQRGDESFSNEGVIKQLSTEKTVFFQRPAGGMGGLLGSPRQTFTPRQKIMAVVLGVTLGILAYDQFLAEPDRPAVVRATPIRPQLPSYVEGKTDSNKSNKIYLEGLTSYVKDTVADYKVAAEKFRAAAGYDITNVRALAMLASSYINLIDSSNKDENYFSVLTKLIDMSRAKAVDLSETVIADVEFFIVVNKAEAAQNRIVEYTKAHPNYGPEMFYYLGYAFYERGDATNAAKFLSQIPDKQIFSAKIYYLRGLIAEKLKDMVSAVGEYKKAVALNSSHVKSMLRIADIYSRQGKLAESKKYVEFIVNHPNLLPARELGLGYFLHAQLSELSQKWDLALGDVERAVKLDPDNHVYLLELYTLRVKAGESQDVAKKQARMYYYLGEGEKLIHLGKYQDALVPLLEARQANDESPLPLIKMGDMFNYLHDIENAKTNYRLAADRAPNSIQVWSKYIHTLIQSYEWEEASKAMDKFRNLQVSQSAIDKAAADMYQKQGKFVEAQTYYKKAMARDSIDPDVYVAYAKSLMSTKNFKDAPFFFALALRFDPLNFDAVINTAKCIAETESIDRAVSLLQDELQQSNVARAEFLAAIAEFQIQKGAWDQAQHNVDAAFQANPEYAYPWKLQAQIFMNREGLDKDALDRALAAYKSYSERNRSDPSGYLERYKIFIKKAKFEEAKEELNRIYEIYPKYPSLHFYLGSLYAVQGNHKIAAEEFRRELANSPDNVATLVAYGKELLESNLVQEALKQFTKAMQLAPGSAEAKQNAGWANHHLKNYQAAVALFRGALAIDQANPAIYKRLGIVYRDMGDIPSACAQFRKYLEAEPDAADKAEFSQCLQ